MKTSISRTVEDLTSKNELVEEVISVRIWDSKGRRIDISLGEGDSLNINAQERLHITPVSSNSINIRNDNEL